MTVTNFLGFFLLIFLSIFQKTAAIMVPSGKIGPITPRKIIPEIIVPLPYREPAQVWERIDEGDNPYKPPVYKYTLLDYARKHGIRTLIPPPENEYYKPKPRVFLRTKLTPIYYKTKFFYSPFQYL